MSDERMIKDLSIRLRSIEEQLQQVQVNVAEIRANQRVSGYVGGVALTAVAGILAKLFLQ